MKIFLPRSRRGVALNVIVLISCLFSTGLVSARAQVVLTANFDNLYEGSVGHSFVNGGITFANLDQRILGANPPGNFIIETTTTNLPGFTLPNYLSFGGYTPGPAYSFGRFGSADIDFDGTATAATMDIVALVSSSGNILMLEGMSGGSVVASNFMSFQSSAAGMVFRSLSISGTFDSLRLVAMGPNDDGAVLFGMDNVRVTLVPEPAAGTVLLMGCGTLAIAGCRSRVARRKRPG